jgi:hypothetical protein
MKAGLMAVLYLWLCLLSAAVVALGTAQALIWANDHLGARSAGVFVVLIIVAVFSLPVYFEFEDSP